MLPSLLLATRFSDAPLLEIHMVDALSNAIPATLKSEGEVTEGLMNDPSLYFVNVPDADRWSKPSFADPDQRSLLRGWNERARILSFPIKEGVVEESICCHSRFSKID